jgi:hypothetical protein
MTALYYAGIGSRKTPPHIQNIMTHIGSYLFSEGWTLRSGAADGADAAFERGVDNIDPSMNPRKEIYLPWAGFNHSTSQLHPGNIPFTDQEKAFTASMHPAWDRCSASARLLHTRNVRQILGCEALHGATVTPIKFVVCWTEQGELNGAQPKPCASPRPATFPSSTSARPPTPKNSKPSCSRSTGSRPRQNSQ